MSGLEGRVGLPHSDIGKGMEEEHCDMPNSDTEYTSTNYQICTTARKEWQVCYSVLQYVAGVRGCGTATPNTPLPTIRSAPQHPKNCRCVAV